MRTTYASRSAACLVLGALSSGLGPDARAADPDAALHDRFAAIERRAAELERTLAERETAWRQTWQRRARAAWAEEPASAATYFNLALPLEWGDVPRAVLLIDTARAEAAAGQWADALKHFASAVAMDPPAHHLAPAFEGFVAAAEHGPSITVLPNARLYVAAVGRAGRLDVVGWETIYRLGRLLAQQGDARGLEMLSLIPPDVAPGRRALYVRAVELLKSGDKAGARDTFEAAASLAPYGPESDGEPERDAEVRELSWLAMGRLAFEGGDAGTGYYAYHQISIDSPRFFESFYELGWLAMETGDEMAAQAAFEPLVEMNAAGIVGPKAQLLRGYLLLRARSYDAAAEHYAKVATSFGGLLGEFDAAVSKVQDPLDLVRECETRSWALTNPWLRPVLSRPEIRSARRALFELESLEHLAFSLDKQARVLDTLIAAESEDNPLRELERDRGAVQTLLDSVHELAAGLDRTASTTPVPCCSEPRERARALQATLEKLQAQVDARQARWHDGLVALRQNLNEQARTQRLERERLTAEMQTVQREAIQRAIGAERDEIVHLMMEGEAGVLQAMWQKKEDGRDEIKHLEGERKSRIDALASRFEELLDEAD